MTNQIKTDQMKKIKDEVLALTKSPLYEYRQANKYYPVIGEGSHDAEIMFIGEAPGKNEALTGRPFCGRAGKILDELLASINLDREKVYVTNIVKDRPPENRDPLPEEIAVYAPFLNQQIAIIKPKVIATLGRFSMKYILDFFGVAERLEPIGRLHGHKLETVFATTGEKIVLIPLFHPAAAIYNQSLKDTLLADFKILKDFI